MVILKTNDTLTRTRNIPLPPSPTVGHLPSFGVRGDSARDKEAQVSNIDNNVGRYLILGELLLNRYSNLKLTLVR